MFGLDFYKIESLNGNSSLTDSFDFFRTSNLSSYATLNPNVVGANPDDAFSTVPYEKGF